MGTRERYEPGTFSWVDLQTGDVDGAKAFYADVFGWEYEDLPAGDDGTYTMCRRDGSVVAGLSHSDTPPHWNSYVTVESAEESAKKADELGGRVIMEAFDVMDAGRMAVLQDPTGAMVCLWEPKQTIGAELVNAPGALTWNDLATHDVGKATEFYCELFGWEVAAVEDAPGDRVVIRNGEQMNGGMAKLPDGTEETPPHWMPYFAVDDLERAGKAVEDGGGEVLVGPMDIPAGKFALCADPQGAAFAVFSGDMDD